MNKNEEIINTWISYIHRNSQNNSIAVLFRRPGDNEMLAKSKIYQLGLPYNENVYLLVGYIGFKQKQSGELSFGEACRNVSLNSDGTMSKTIENHFVSIVKEDDINSTIYHFYKLLDIISKKSLKLNLYKFMQDLLYIGSDKRYVQQRWSKEFWTPKHTENN